MVGWARRTRRALRRGLEVRLGVILRLPATPPNGAKLGNGVTRTRPDGAAPFDLPS